jgi:hypothetical protein
VKAEGANDYAQHNAFMDQCTALKNSADLAREPADRIARQRFRLGFAAEAYE